MRQRQKRNDKATVTQTTFGDTGNTMSVLLIVFNFFFFGVYGAVKQKPELVLHITQSNC